MSSILEYSSSDFGLVIEIFDWASSPSNYTVLIKFDANNFVQFPVPEVELLSYINYIFYPEDVFRRL